MNDLKIILNLKKMRLTYEHYKREQMKQEKRTEHYRNDILKCAEQFNNDAKNIIKSKEYEICQQKSGQARLSGKTKFICEFNSDLDSSYDSFQKDFLPSNVSSGVYLGADFENQTILKVDMLK